MPIDYSKYPPNWKTEIVPRILDRDGNCCKFCGVPNKESLYSVMMSVRVNGKYKKKRIWVSSINDAKRIEQIDGCYDTKKVKVVLTVAHLDHDEENHEVKDERLAALCQWCHLNYDAKEKYRRMLEKGKKKREAMR